jgi:transposase
MDVPPQIRNLIVCHLQAGHSCRSIAQMVAVPKSTVIRLVKRFKTTGNVQATRQGNCGRPPLLSQRDERLLARTSVVKPTLNARELRASVGGRVSYASISTVQRALRRQGRFSYRPKKSPSLNAAQRLTRLKWCKKHMNWDEERWRKVRKD